MPTNRLLPGVPPVPILLAASVLLATLLWQASSVKEDLPFFVSSESDYLYLELSGPGLSPGVYQLNDGLPVSGVKELTCLLSGSLSPSAECAFPPAINGARYQIIKNDQKIELVQRGWMSAGKRIALGIALHPDQMSRSDWTALPGIGEKLAERIHIDRQKNGDFGSLDALKRVKGIGAGSIENWRHFFSDT